MTISCEDGKGNQNSHTCFVTKYISDRPRCPSEPPSPPKLYFMPRYKRPCLLDVETFCSRVDVIERVHDVQGTKTRLHNTRVPEHKFNNRELHTQHIFLTTQQDRNLIFG